MARPKKQSLIPNLHGDGEMVPAPKHPKSITPIEPANAHQRFYLEAIRNNTLTIGIGPAGSGKTLLAVYESLKHHYNKANQMKRIIISRPAIEAGEKIGYLPGNLEEKLDPYMRPIFDCFYNCIGVEETKKKIEMGIIEIAPIGYLRGRTFSDAFVIVDEAQNASYEQLKMVTTRIGENCKLVLTGDPQQIDIQNSGLVKIVRAISNVSDVATVKFDYRDIVRSKIVIDIVKALEDFEKDS